MVIRRAREIPSACSARRRSSSSRPASGTPWEGSLQVPRGERVVVLGASGSDKSTLLHAITGIVPHTVTAGSTGEMSLGVRTKDTSVVERSRHLGVPAQDTHRPRSAGPVEQELMLPCRTMEGSPSGLRRHAAALVTEPEVLLLDGPCRSGSSQPAGHRALELSGARIRW